ncbi:MAG: hypothetical protein ACYC27_05225 [Armatimonadota bacterium]
MSFADNLRKAKVDEEIIEQIMNVDCPRDETNENQDTANFYAAAMKKCEELLDFDTISDVMFTKSCCKGGYRLNNAKQLAKDHGDKPIEEKLVLLGELKYMGKPHLNADGDIEGPMVGTYGSDGMTCPCWYFKGCTPVNGPMPLTYCLCCAGHFKVHYQKALGVKLRVKKVVSSIINSGGKLPCSFVYEIV